MLRVFDKILGLVQSPKASSEDLAAEIIAQSIPRDKETGYPIVFPDREKVYHLIREYVESNMECIQFPKSVMTLMGKEDPSYKNQFIDMVTEIYCDLYFDNIRKGRKSSAYSLMNAPKRMKRISESYLEWIEKLYLEGADITQGAEQ